MPLEGRVEFMIDLVLGATLIANELCRLNPTEMQELSTQLHVKKKDESHRMCIDY